MSSPTILWQPDAAALTQSQMAVFMQHVNETHDTDLHTYARLHAWSINEKALFWQTFSNFAKLTLQQPADAVYTPHADLWKEKWFCGSRLNFAENLLRYRDDNIALEFFDETGHHQQLSYAGLYRETGRIATWLRQQGIRPGDRIAGFAANRIETIVAMLASASVGAIWSSCSPDFGVNGILDRFSQITPKVLFAVSSHLYGGKTIRHEKTLLQLLEKLPSLDHVVLLPELYAEDRAGDMSSGRHVQWRDISATNEVLQFHAAEFNDPLFIMYSSGTTGVPKCIVHGVGGTLLQHRKEHMLHVDLRRSDTLFYFTTCGWMMWNWLVSGLASGARIILYDGSPFHPGTQQLFDLAEHTGISVFGVSAKYLSAAQKAGLEPARTHDLQRIRTILSTGSPLSAEGFDYVYESVSPTASLQSISGGTDIISCFVLGAPLVPVYRGEIQCAGLGMDVAVFDQQGERVNKQKGELVCRQSFPSMPVGFWNDPDASKYQAAYFERFPGVWTHGDYAEETSRGTFIIYGRSDTVLNPGGVRIGTAEIYRQVEQLPEILEAVVAAQQWQDDVRVVLFVRLAEGMELDEALQRRIRQTIRQGASPRHVPALILQVQDIPRTLSGKIAEIAVRDLINGQPVRNTDALANPQSLEEYRRLREILA